MANRNFKWLIYHKYIKKKSNPQTLFTLPSLRVFFSDKARDLQLKNVSRTKETPFSPPSLRVILQSKIV